MSTIASKLLLASIWLAPWVGVGLVQLLLGRSLGTGVQPAFPLLALAFAFALLARSKSAPVERDLLRRDLTWVALALGWTFWTTSFAWRANDMGLAGEVPWEKAAKQFALLAFFVAIGVTPAWVLACCSRRAMWLRAVERAVCGGLLLVSAVGVLQALHFHHALPGLDTLNAWLRTNGSIASGSEELYLGHAFVGIPRVRGTFPEPLLFGSYLGIAVPIAAVAAWAARGRARAWRAVAAGVGLVALVLTFSRGAYLGAAAGGALVAVGMVRGHLPRPSSRALAGGILAAALLVGIGGAAATGRAPWELPALLVERLAQSLASHDMSNLTRTLAWKAAAQMTLDHPVAGAGWGSFGFQYFPLAGDAGSGAHFGWPVTNNFVLLVASETGLVGLALWARAFWPAFCGLFPRKRPFGAQTPSLEDITRFGLAVLCAASLVQGMSFSQWNLPHLWLLAGFSAWFGRRGWGVV